MHQELGSATRDHTPPLVVCVMRFAAWDRNFLPRSGGAAGVVVVGVGCGVLAGLAGNYVLSLCFVFTQSKDRGKGRSFGAFLVFGVIGLVGLAWTELGMWIGIEVLSWNYMFVKVCVTAAVLAWNYLGRKLIIFNSGGVMAK